MKAKTTLPKLPTKPKIFLVQAEIPIELWKAALTEIQVRKLSRKAVVEWGLKAFVKASNPKRAAELGITDEN